MRIKHAIFAGSMAALVSLTAPALAKNSAAKATSEQPAALSCSALQQTTDGTWARLPCQEVDSSRQTPRQSATRGSDQQTR